MKNKEIEFETLHSNKHRICFLIGFVCVVVLLVVFIVSRSFAKFRVTESIPLVNGTINNNLADLNAVAVYIQDGDDYSKSDTIPSSGYAFNEERSYCTVNGEADEGISLSYDADTQSLSVSPLTTKGTKCYLYFDEQKGNTMSEIIAGYNKGNRGSFSSAYTASTTNTVFQTTDWEGTSYYFAGAPTDNWVRFGGFYWRIVRVNGDGSVRLIYNGTSTTTIGSGTMISNSQAFNSSYNRSEYVGLKYTTGQQHGQNTDSPILDTLQSWYTSSELSATQYSQHIDTNVGFCSDRVSYSNTSGTTTSWVSTGSTIYYAAYVRLITNKSPSLDCTSSDVIKEPVGLITADEVAFAGGVWGTTNQSYYLYNNANYRTMSPYYFGSSGSASVFYVRSDGYLSSSLVVYTYDVRPVINLKADTKFQGSGTSDLPFEVVS